jgi:ESS family glutamate:Na+ symporter
MEALPMTIDLSALTSLALSLPGLGLALGLLALLLVVGTALGRLLGMHQWGIPEALLAGGVGLLLAPSGAVPLIPAAVIHWWDQLPLVLLTLVFASLLLGKPLPAIGGLWRPLSGQILLALTLAFGQYLVAALAVLLLLQPLLGAPAVMACLIEVAYEGGHGSAAAMGPTYARLGLESGEALGLALATVGLLASTVVGGMLVLLGRRRGWTLLAPTAEHAGGATGAASEGSTTAGELTELRQAAAAAPSPGPGAGSGPSPASAGAAHPGTAEPESVRGEASSPCGGEGAGGPAAASRSETAAPAAPQPPAGPQAAATPAGVGAIAVNLALTGSAVLLGCAMLQGLRLLAAWQGGLLAMVVDALPVFPLALLGSLLVRLLLERSGRSGLVLPRLQGRIGTLSADLLITAATACLDLSLLARDWLPLTVLAVLGLVWNLAVVLLLAPRILPASWFERGLVEFGQATGVAASGLLLLNMVDPEDRNGSLTPFSIKQLILQPFLAGGVITVVAPLAVTSWGLPAWTVFCLALVLLWIGLGLWLGRQGPQPS